MAIIVDAAPLAAFADRDDPVHDQVRNFLEATSEALFVSPFALAEADYLVSRDLGVSAELGLLTDVAEGAFVLEGIEGADLRRCIEIIDRYRDLDIGLADASAVLLAERHRTRRILTFDERHFRALRPASGEPFVLLPTDEPRRRKR